MSDSREIDVPGTPSETERATDRLEQAREALASALRVAGFDGEGLDIETVTCDGTGTVASGPALAFRASLWALRPPADGPIGELVLCCGRAWAQYAAALPCGDARREAERAAQTCGIEDP
jgi:hypothetical protein